MGNINVIYLVFMENTFPFINGERWLKDKNGTKRSNNTIYYVSRKSKA